MKSVVIFATLLIAAYGSSIINQIKSDENKELKYVGTADGKAYYFDNSVPRTWEEAGKVCTSADMQLASISSENQLALLNSTTTTALPIGPYWTAGRDSFEVRQFNWNDTNVAVPELIEVIFTGTYYYSEYLTCLMLGKDPDRTHLFIIPCALTGFTLCSN